MAINKAIISEKSFASTSASKYTFTVSTDMDKNQIAAAVEKLYSVKVAGVNTAKIIGKVKRNRKGQGKRSDFKKAIVTLAGNGSIGLFDVEGDKKEAKKESKETKENKKEIADNKEVKTVIREPKKGLLGRTTNK